ncbi:transcription repressor OFP15-like [Iris pallida]|uniref:Transcription repressor n=1 Tax=Iris pallida TaxID=29817 RepID=A0AAX6DFG0_IRIPA|nr:transcription repressor OFP15-like [Iris pallida]
MGKKKKKLGFTSLIFGLGDTTVAATTPTAKPNPSSSSSSSSWAWPSCKKQQRTDSSRADESSVCAFGSTDSFFTHSSEDNNSESFSTTSDNNNDPESLIRGLVRSSDRLFVEPGGDTSSILEEAAKGGGGGGAASTYTATTDTTSPFKESVAMAVESRDPYLDFKKSMEEMVAAYGLTDWECLEDLLVWYLRVNGKKTHGYIVGAFVDLLVGLASADGGDVVDRGDEEEEEESGDLLPSISSSSCCGSSSMSLSSRNCNYEIEEVEDHAC